jgi:molybdenum cofactor biosynthesis enzyme
MRNDKAKGGWCMRAMTPNQIFYLFIYDLVKKLRKEQRTVITF